MNEWGFTGEVKSWIDQIAKLNSNLPFAGARVEDVGKGSKKRRDLTLIDRDGEAIMTGEVKLPDAPDGGSPYRAEVVKDAQQKALRAGVKFFFTWNVNECVLWETATAGAGLKDRAYERWSVIALTNRAQLEATPNQAKIYEWLVTFLHEAARILKSGKVGGGRTPDVKFVEALEAALTVPIRHTHDALAKRYVSNHSFKRDLDQWMVSLGWTVVSDTEGLHDLLERAAKFGCYLFVNKLVFHEALLKKYGKTMAPLNAPPEITTGDDLQMRLQYFFAEAKEVTGDYETIFGDDPKDMGRRIPFYADAAVQGWRGLIDQIHEFDFSKLDYEVVGSIFERLIGPEERHKYGQFYTRVEVVDLINSFCIRTGDAKVLDPACGGGTFLVRAYARKKVLAENRNHRDLLTDVYGTDISQFAAHLTTMNLATRDLVEDENYPRVGRSDFFNVLPDSPFVKLPQKLKSEGLGTKYQNISIPPLDAVIANPPYVRQEDIPRAKIKPKDGGPEAGTKEFYSRRVVQMANAKFSGRSDLHCYFWPHATTFLKPDGMLGFITSSQWLDVEYGFHLQRWLLQNFEVLAVLESPVEPWFVGARVGTAVTIARRCEDTARRAANTVRFVQLRKPLNELIQNDGTTLGAVLAADGLRDEIMHIAEDVSHARYRARLVNQADLWREGVELGRIMRGEDAEDAEGTNQEGSEITDENRSKDDYFGGKWGIYLRAPDLWFELQSKFGDKFVPLGQLAHIRRGVTSGKDGYFFPIDVTAKCLSELTNPETFEHEFGVPRKPVETGEIRLVMAGEKRGQLHAIESEYLEPEVHSLMDVDSFVVDSSQCSKLIFLAPSAAPLKPYAKAYVKWGETMKYHNNPTCESRETSDSHWYDLSRLPRPNVILPKIQQYRLIAFLNPENLYQNSSLLGLYGLSSDEADYFAGLLNSTFGVLPRLLYSRSLGNEGNSQLDVYSAKMLPVVASQSTQGKKRVGVAFKAMAARKAMSFVPERRMRQAAFERQGKHAELEYLSGLCELDMPDRRALDHAVLELLGVKAKKEREEWINRLYDDLRQHFEKARSKEEQAIVNKNATKRKGAVSPQDLATQLAAELNTQEPGLFRTYKDFFNESSVGDSWIAREIPADGTPEMHSDLHDVGVRFMRGKKQIEFVGLPSEAHAALAVVAIQEMRRETVRLPRAEMPCATLLRDYQAFLNKRNQRLRDTIAERVADEDVQAVVFGLLVDQVRRGAKAPTVR
ncbi:HsdM family class I SAM-dependent methyltransferase [Rhodoferax fermentans]|uniref:site-specific DNA-methyltransferase (adenine-specific) n=1 Tax=Rhodoferax fermentans TaxID=28066 RepID=A0A1T1AS24_RHOFE|nr:N-6 DNA methylase [Rhodoferax fermentans]MBK1683707.1 SAM-dependent DNA methyltransferase [Rhodoferax fermentans]OOV06914.1 SAM-dependent methyltransferase [Rhodoferax fermentans]